MNDEQKEAEERRRALSPVLTIDEFEPLSSVARVEIGARTHRGKNRPHNEDHYLVLRLSRSQDTLATSLSGADLPPRFLEYGYGVLVADGLGGEGPGALASRVALSALAHLLIHFGHWNLRVDADTASQIVDRGSWFYQRVHDAVVHESRANPLLSGMATTLTAGFSAGNDLFLGHVGHSRAYLFRDGDLTQLTDDHTLVQRMAAGPPGPAPVDSATEDLKHILTETIGGRAGGPQVDVNRFKLWDRDSVLYCTDGLSSMVDDDQIADVLSLRRGPDEQCRALVDLALKRGGEDNITAVIAEYQLPHAPSSETPP